MRVVVDASVAVKWLLPARHEEPQQEQALQLLDAVRNDQVQLIQPPHWLAEVGAVLARLEPALAVEALALFQLLETASADTPEVYATAIDLAVTLDHHLFDTLYHAVALNGLAATLVTADLRYYRKARHLGAICTLAEYRDP